MQGTFRRLAIVNRGEPAMRVIHAVRELNDVLPDPIALIALYTEPERRSMFVRQADEAVCLGPALIQEGGGHRSGYLDYRALERSLVEAGADAAWVGWGFVAEHPEFAELCERLGIVFIGPDAAVMRRLGDKIQAKLLAEATGVPVAPWSGGPVTSVEAAIRMGKQIGFPLMVKASAGGGGRGIRRVDEPAALPGAFESARSEALDAFGDSTMLMERVMTPARHVEVQVIADGQGSAWALGVRDCSCQRRNQKVIEESASPALTPEQQRELQRSAARLAIESGYRNAATVEFLYQPDDRSFSFMEVNARLQVEHPVTEMVTGVDLVKLQLHVAAGGRLEGDPPPPHGHAIEARLNAEDPELGFAPAPGRVELLRLPTGPGVRVDTGIAEGDVIPAEFDSMVAKIIAWGHDRDEALARLRRAMRETMVVIDGGTTNQGFLLELLDRAELRGGEIDTTWLDRLQVGGEIAPVRHADVALLQAAIELDEAEVAVDRARFYAFARRGRPQADASTSRTIELRHHNVDYRFTVSCVGPARYRVCVDGDTVDVDVERLDTHTRRLTVAGIRHGTLVSRQGTDVLVEVDGVPHRISCDDGGLVRNLAPALVVAIPVAIGEEVDAGDVVAVVESMKMESSLVAPFRGRVREVLVGPNVQVRAGQTILALERLDDVRDPRGGERVRFSRAADPPAVDPSELYRTSIQHMEWLMLGYDIDSGEARRLLESVRGGDVADADPGLLADEHRLLGLFADLRSLVRPQHEEADPNGELLRSPHEYLLAYLRSLDAEAEGVSPRFVELLDRALAHYGIEGRERTPALEEACHRLFLSQQRVESARAIVLAILDRRLERAEHLIGELGDEFREALDRLLAAAEGRDPGVVDRAREVRYHYFDEPLIDAAREQVYLEVEGHLAALRADSGRADREALVAALVASPRPLAPMLSRRMRDADPAMQDVMLEVTTRRYYRMRKLHGFAVEVSAGRRLLTTSYDQDGAQRHLATAFIELDDLAEAARAFAAWAQHRPEGERTVADFYAQHRGPPPPRDELAAALRATLQEVALPVSVRRIVVAVSEARRGRGMSAVDLFTFRPGADGIVEDEVLRGLHPMMAERLAIRRFSNFALEQLPAPEDVYLFRGLAHDNAKDERLFAIAEVRDLTPVRDEGGSLLALPEFERMLGEALEAIRGVQAHRKPRERLHWNRVNLYVWPTIEFSREEMVGLVERMGPATAGLGIEMLLIRARMSEGGRVRDRLLRFFNPTRTGVVLEVDDPPARPLAPLDEGARRLVAARRRGTVHPAEIIKLMAPRSEAGPGWHQPVGEFVEHDLDAGGRLVPTDRPPATNPAAVVVGLIRNVTDRYPEGMLRVVVLGDPTKALGSLAEPECRRIIAALDLAEELRVPLEWFALSAGATIAMDSGTENMDWIAAVLRRIIEFTQAGGEVNVVVSGINVGAQPYWNAEATMLMHTRGILVMTPESAMVLTGKQALDYSGGVSAEDNFGIGGFERIMGPNGQAQYWAADLPGACRLLLDYYDHTYVAPGERFPRRAPTADPPDRDVGDAPHAAPGSDLRQVRDVFSDATNPDRKRPFDVRSVMRATIDRDHPPLERWAAMRDAESAVVWDATLGGWPVTVLGIESRPLQRHGLMPADGPEQWTSGTLFPRSSKKVARAINAASGRRPVVVLANLAGFDGSPESMREWQLEFGAEIGRAVVNFDGPIVFCVISRYHGGAFVVFSQRLNDGLETVAVAGAKASVIGGAAAAGVVFARDVDVGTRRDPRIVDLDERIAAAEGTERRQLRAQRERMWAEVRAEQVGALAARFDEIHSVERAVRVGSVSQIIPSASLRPFLIEAVERGIRRTLDRSGVGGGDAGVAQPLGG